MGTNAALSFAVVTGMLLNPIVQETASKKITPPLFDYEKVRLLPASSGPGRFEQVILESNVTSLPDDQNLIHQTLVRVFSQGEVEYQLNWWNAKNGIGGGQVHAYFVDGVSWDRVKMRIESLTTESLSFRPMRGVASLNSLQMETLAFNSSANAITLIRALPGTEVTVYEGTALDDDGSQTSSISDGAELTFLINHIAGKLDRAVEKQNSDGNGF